MISFGTSRFRHAGQVQAIAASPDGKYLASATVFGHEETILWDARTGEPVFRVARPSDNLSFSPDGTRLSIAYSTAGVWSVPEGKLVAEYPLFSRPVALGADGLVAGWLDGAGAVRLLNGRGEEHFRIKCQRPSGLAFSEDGGLLALGQPTGKVLVYSVAGKERVVELKAASAEPASVAFVPRGRIATGAGTWVRVWAMPQGELEWEQEVSGRVESVSVSPFGGRVIASDWSANKYVFRSHGGQPVTTFRVPRSETGVAFVDSTDVVAMGRANAVVTYATDTGVLRDVAEGHLGSVRTMALSRDGDLCVTGSEDHTAWVWNVAEGRAFSKIEHDNAIEAVALAPDGSLVATSSADDTVCLSGAQDGLCQERYKSEGAVFDTGAVAFSPSGRRCACDAQDGVRLIDLGGPGRTDRIVATNGAVCGLAFLDEDHLCILTEERLRLWVLGTSDRLVAEATGSFEHVFAASADGPWVAARRQQDLCVYRGDNLRLHRTFPEPVTACAISSQSLLAMVHREGSILIRDLESKEKLAEPKVAAPPSALAFATDGRLFVGTLRGTVEQAQVAPSRRLRQELSQQKIAEGQEQVRDLLGQLALRLGTGGYRGTSRSDLLDPDGMGLRLEPVGEAVSVRFDVTLGRFELQIGAPTQSGAEHAGQSPRKSIGARLGSWLKSALSRAPKADRGPEPPEWLAQLFGGKNVLAVWIDDGARVVAHLRELPTAAELEQQVRRVAHGLAREDADQNA